MSSSEALDHVLPDEPVVRIRPSGKRAVVDLKEVWAYRELLYFLTWRDVKIRYKQAVLGIAWAVLQPFVTMVVFTLFFGKLAKVPSDGIPYPIFSYAALLPWSFFQAAVANGGNSLVGSSHLIKKVYFPRLLVPASAVAAALVDFAIAFVMFIALFAYYRVAITPQVLLLPLLVILTTALALGIALWTSALNVKYRDVRHALPFVLQVWMFVSPVIYPSSMMPERWRWVLALNPLTGVIDGYRASLLGRPVPWGALGYSAAIAVGVLLLAAIEFRRMEREFADIV
jgi:lipopolysaccharide transport system permease protein